MFDVVKGFSDAEDFYPEVEDVPEACGFAVRDMVVYNDLLWVATEFVLNPGQML